MRISCCFWSRRDSTVSIEDPRRLEPAMRSNSPQSADANANRFPVIEPWSRSSCRTMNRDADLATTNLVTKSDSPINGAFILANRGLDVAATLPRPCRHGAIIGDTIFSDKHPVDTVHFMALPRYRPNLPRWPSCATAAGTRKPSSKRFTTTFWPSCRPARSCIPASSATTTRCIPELNIAILAQHDMLFLGEKGQAKSRLMRLMASFLDEEIPYIDDPQIPVHDDPLRPITRRGRQLVTSVPADEVPIAWWPREERYAERLAPGTKFADIIGEIDPAKLAAGVSMGVEDALHFGLIPRMHRGIFAMNELPELDELVQVGLFNILEERDVQIRGYPVQVRHRRADPVQREPGHVQPLRQSDPAAQGPHRLDHPHALSAGARSGHSDRRARSRRSEERGARSETAKTRTLDPRSSILDPLTSSFPTS